MKKASFRAASSSGLLTVDICHCRDSSKEELARLGSNGNTLTLARYRGELYSVIPFIQSPCRLCHSLKVVHRPPLEEIEAVYAAFFEVLYRGNWYPCFMIGGITQTAQDVSVVADDPQHTSGLGSANNSYMWGSGVEIDNGRIEGVRLWLSNPVDPRLLVP